MKIKDTFLFKFLNIWLLTSLMVQLFAPTVYAVSDIKSGYKHAFAFKSPSIVSQKDAKKLHVTEATKEAKKTTVKKQAFATKAMGGPGQVESSSFSLNTTGEMVDPFTGDFSYSIPLMDVEGYPLVLSYNSNVGMQDEASWVGLGWSLNVGSISRQMRGVPDEFDGTDVVQNIHSVKEDNITQGEKTLATLGVMFKANESARISKGLDLTIGYGSYKSEYLGKGQTFDLNVGVSIQKAFPSNDDDIQKMLGLRGGFGYSSDTKNGIGSSASIGISGDYANSAKMVSGGGLGLAYGANYHSRAGVTSRSLNANTSGAFSFSNKFVSGSYPQVGLGATFTLGSFSYVPKFENSTTTSYSQFITDVSVSYKKTSASRWGFVAGIESQTYNSTSILTYSNASSKLINNPAYGYLHSEKRDDYPGGDYPIMDFNRERDGEFSEEMKNLPFSMAMYDVFYANGFGLNNTFRAHRNDAGVYKDATNTNTSDAKINNPIVGAQIEGGTPKLKIGYTYSETDGDGESGRWSNGGEVFQFSSDDNIQFKTIGEMTPKNSNLKGLLGGEMPAYLKLEGVDQAFTEPAINKTNILISANNIPTTISASGLSNENVRDLPLTIYLPTYAGNPSAPSSSFYNSTGTLTPFSRVDAIHKSNHISTFKVTSPDGMNYHYNLPVYSISEQQVLFSTNETNDADGLCSYTAGADNSTSNTNGRSYLYDKQTVPGYATSFLLTNITSSDYYDVSNDGYSLDDIGNYYTIDYTRVYDQNNPYKWRFPYESNKAFFNQGLIASEKDNTASYTYGEKEIWYTKSIESKNLIAVFTLEDRDDTKAVLGENGGMDTGRSLKKLAKIELYNRNERITNPSARPLQTIEFEYDYSLCPGTPSNVNGAGKLTLKKIRVYSGGVSQETALHPYEFIYSSQNPEFKNQSVDRWGNYTVETVSKPIEYFPYANQDPGVAEPNASTWKLVTVISPNGSELNVSYEADTYRYVQNQRAMEHIDVKGYTTPIELGYLLNQSTWNGSNKVYNKFQNSVQPSDYVGWVTNSPLPDGDPSYNSGVMTGEMSLYNNKFIANTVDKLSNLILSRQMKDLPCNVLVYKLNEAVSIDPVVYTTKTALEQKIRDEYFRDHKGELLQEVYVKSFVKIDQSGKFELIPTFAQIDQFPDIYYFSSRPAIGLMPPDANGNYNYGYVILKNVLSDEEDNQAIALSPIHKSAMQFARLNLPDIIYDQSTGGFDNLNLDRKAFWTGDIYHAMAKEDLCEEMITTMPTQVRLFDHDNWKIGGNARVKSIKILDKWNAMSGEESNEYTWLYNYKDFRDFSKGVAAFEPAVGNDENPFFGWDGYSNEAIKFPDESKFTIKPIGEMLFPSPVVGYSLVTLTMEGSNTSNSNGLGTSEYHFYTAKDFPTVYQSTGLQKTKADRMRYMINEIDLFGLSQGHIIITNDFHGKPYQSFVYNKQGDLQGRTTYKYRGVGEKLDMLDRTATLQEYLVATEFDVAVDSRLVENESKTLSVGATLAFPLPTFLPLSISPILSVKKRKVGFYSHVINKHINYSAIVESIETEQLGSVNTARNILYDKFTGEVILSSLNDEFDDELFAFSYPAHWYYTNMRSPLESLDAATGTFSGTPGSYTFTSSSGSLKNKLTVGDLVAVTNGGAPVNAYVIVVNGNTAKLINTNATGTSFTLSGTCTITVTTSGRKNTLGGSMQSVTTKTNPLNVAGTVFTLPATDIIQASAMTLRPRLNVLCSNTGYKLSTTIGSTINPFLFGLLDNYFIENSYSPQLERSSSEIQGIRFNGTYINYFPFYDKNTNQDWVQIDEASHPNADLANLKNWRPNGEITVTDEYGQPIESKDVLNVSSAVIYGYNRMHKLIPVANASNALQNEIAFDSFDDYNYFSSGTTNFVAHFDFNSAVFPANSDAVISTSTRHSGIASLAVSPTKTALSSRNVIPSSTCTNPGNSFDDSEFLVRSCTCVKPFEPFSNKSYVVSLWVKGNGVNAQNAYTDCSVRISFLGSATTFTFTPSGQMIDGWQRVEGIFTIPASATKINVELMNGATNGGNIAYFDDLRIHPQKAAMSTVVYDPENLLPMATHDAYNFTTFYNYDENLSQVRVRVETINGIQTVSESESSSVMKFKQ